MPTGVLNDPALITVPRDTGGTVILQDVVDMFARLYKGTAGSPVWVANHEIMPELMMMVDAGNNLVWQPNARESTAGQLFGYPVYMTEKTPDVGTTGDLMLCDFSKYAVAIGPDLYLDKNNTVGWYRDFSSYRCIARLDGAGLWSAPFQSRTGQLYSWCVALGA